MVANKILGAVLMIMLWMIAQPLVGAGAQEQSDSTESQLRELKGLYQKDLISEDLYRRKVDELLSTGQACRASPKADAAATGSVPNISGTWQLTVEDLSIWAPPYTLPKVTGDIRWQVLIIDGELSLLEVDAGSDMPGERPDEARSAGDLFKEVDVREVIIRDDLIAFKVAVEAGAYEAYWLEEFSEDTILGTYTAYDLYGGGPGSGPEYRARLKLQKVE